MKSVLPVQLGANRAAMLQSRVQAVTQVRAHGTQKLPAAPRAVSAQAAEGGALLTWHLPERYEDVTGYRIYVGSEKNLAIQVRDRGTRQMFVPLQAGAAPPNTNIYVSTVNGFREGPRQLVQGAALANAQTPGAKPVPSSDYLAQFSGGLDKTQSGQPSGSKTP